LPYGFNRNSLRRIVRIFSPQHWQGRKPMYQLLDRQHRLTANQWKMIATANLGDTTCWISSTSF
jgi:hypothetical protein